MEKKEKLRKNYEFKKVYQGGKSKVTRNTVIFYRKNKQVLTRLGISISKKVGKSVTRNRLKRLYSEAFYCLKDRVSKGYDIVIVARKGAGELGFAEVRDELKDLLKKGKLLI